MQDLAGRRRQRERRSSDSAAVAVVAFELEDGRRVVESISVEACELGWAPEYHARGGEALVGAGRPVELDREVPLRRDTDVETERLSPGRDRGRSGPIRSAQAMGMCLSSVMA